MFQGIGGSLRAVFELKLFQNVLDMAFDGIDGNGQLVGDLLVAGSAGDKAQHEQFPFGQGLLAFVFIRHAVRNTLE